MEQVIRFKHDPHLLHIQLRLLCSRWRFNVPRCATKPYKNYCFQLPALRWTSSQVEALYKYWNRCSMFGCIYIYSTVALLVVLLLFSIFRTWLQEPWIPLSQFNTLHVWVACEMIPKKRYLHNCGLNLQGRSKVTWIFSKEVCLW